MRHSELARAKVNLCLHVTGRRPDGMHLLDSVVVFPDVGDYVDVFDAPEFALTIDGPFADGLSTSDNLVHQAARIISPRPVALHLRKMLPVAAGIGGGSADAAATLRALARLWNTPLPEKETLVKLGADVPVCIAQQPVRMEGIGEVISPLPALPDFWIVLVNAGEPVDTAAVFNVLTKRDNTKISPLPPAFHDRSALFGYLGHQRNDMESAARKVSPRIAFVLEALRGVDACELARMSGSGGTCFGLFNSAEDATRAARAIRSDHPNWWVVDTKV